MADSSGDEYSSAANSIRETAKWLITAFAALIAVLIGTSPLTKVSQLPHEQFVWALVAGIACIVAAGIAIKLASDILIAQTFFLSDISKVRFLRKMIDQHAADLLPKATPTFQKFVDRGGEILEKLAKTDLPVSERSELLDEYEVYKRVTSRLLGVASNTQLTQKFKQVRTGLFGLAAFGAACVGVLVSELSPLEANDKRPALEVTCATPVSTDAGMQQKSLDSKSAQPSGSTKQPPGTTQPSGTKRKLIDPAGSRSGRVFDFQGRRSHRLRTDAA